MSKYWGINSQSIWHYSSWGRVCESFDHFNSFVDHWQKCKHMYGSITLYVGFPGPLFGHIHYRADSLTEHDREPKKVNPSRKEVNWVKRADPRLMPVKYYGLGVVIHQKTTNNSRLLEMTRQNINSVENIIEKIRIITFLCIRMVSQ